MILMALKIMKFFSRPWIGDKFDDQPLAATWWTTGSRSAGVEPGVTTSPSSSSVLHSFRKVACSKSVMSTFLSMQPCKIQFLMCWEMSTVILCIQAPKTNSERIQDSCKAGPVQGVFLGQSLGRSWLLGSMSEYPSHLKPWVCNTWDLCGMLRCYSIGPSGISDLNGFASLGSPIPCQVIWHAIGRGCSCIAENKVFVFASRKREVEEKQGHCTSKLLNVTRYKKTYVHVCTYVRMYVRVYVCTYVPV